MRNFLGSHGWTREEELQGESHTEEWYEEP